MLCTLMCGYRTRVTSLEVDLVYYQNHMFAVKVVFLGNVLLYVSICTFPHHRLSHLAIAHAKMWLLTRKRVKDIQFFIILITSVIYWVCWKLWAHVSVSYTSWWFTASNILFIFLRASISFVSLLYLGTLLYKLVSNIFNRWSSWFGCSWD